MMFWYGAHWAFWQTGLMWVGMIAFWGLLILGGLRAGQHRPAAGRQGTRRPGTWRRRAAVP